jgi:hypothetical protein
MKNLRVKSFEASLQYDYAVCEVLLCEQESKRLAMTETRFVDFCDDHYNIYILGEE